MRAHHGTGGFVMDDESLESIVAVALERIRANLERDTPFMAQRVRT